MTPQSPFSDSIFALSSGRLPAGVAVIRLSGPDVKNVVRAVCGVVPQARLMKTIRFQDMDGGTIDHGLSVVFESPKSFTGEDCAEFHLHGGRAVVSRMLEVLGGIPGMRMAEAGEFTRRAFVNGKVDLTAAEALSDLIEAETEAQRRFAVENAEGGQKALYSAWREQIIKARALIEAELDFADEEDVPGSLAERVWGEMENLAGEMLVHAAGYKRAEIIREGFKVAIVGAPNAGKSSLLNTLAKRDAAIVSDEPGTTRDVVTVTLDLDGIAVIVSDTAGIRENPGTVESMGIERSFRTAQEADLVIVLHEYGSQVADFREIGENSSISVVSKIDLAGEKVSRDGTGLAISTKTGAGIDTLVREISRLALEAAGSIGDILPSRERHLQEIQSAAALISNAVAGVDEPLELRAEELRIASVHLGRIIGNVDVEDLLDVIFSTFCIGK